MQTHGEIGISSLYQPRPTFSIIEEFAQLQAGRKLLLCRLLREEGPITFHNTVQAIWPDAMASDIRKLEKFVMLLKEARHRKK